MDSSLRMKELQRQYSAHMDEIGKMMNEGKSEDEVLEYMKKLEPINKEMDFHSKKIIKDYETAKEKLNTTKNNKLSILWHKDASLPEIICTVLFLFFCFTGVFVFFSNFTPSELSKQYSVYIIFFTSVLFFFPSLSMLRKFPDFEFGKKILYGIFWFSLIYGVMYISLIGGVPSILVKYIGNEFEYGGTISEKKGGHWNRRGCDYEIVVDNYYTFIGKDICVTENIWNKVNKGDYIVLIGKEFLLGKRILAVRYETNNH